MSMTGGEKTDLPHPGHEPDNTASPDSSHEMTPRRSSSESPVRALLGSMRFIAILFWLTVIFGTLLFVLPRYRDTINTPFFFIFVGLSIALFLAYYFFPFEGYHPVLFLLLMVATDVFIGVLVYLTDGSDSDLFLLYMAVILFSAAYLDMLLTVLVAVMTSAVYFAPVVYDEKVNADILKTMTFTVPIFIILTICASLLINKARQEASEKDVVTNLLRQADLKRQELATLYSSSLKLATTLDYHEIGETLIGYATDLLLAESAFLLLDLGEPPGELVGSYGITGREVEELLEGTSDNPVLLSADAVLPVILNAEDDDPRFRSFIEDHPQVGSLLSVPLFASTRVIGTICCLSSVNGTFDDDSARLLLTLASQAAVAIDKSMLYRTTLEDKLKIEAIINSLNDGIIVIDKQGQLILANPSTQRFLGISADDFGLPIATVLERLRSPWKLKENTPGGVPGTGDGARGDGPGRHGDAGARPPPFPALRHPPEGPRRHRRRLHPAAARHHRPGPPGRVEERLHLHRLTRVAHAAHLHPGVRQADERRAGGAGHGKAAALPGHRGGRRPRA